MLTRTAVAVAALCLAAPVAGCGVPSNWRVLFDGTSLKDWKGYKTDGVPSGWKVEEGALAKDGHVGDLITKDAFGDFELELDWKIGREGNSGIFYRGVEDPD